MLKFIFGFALIFLPLFAQAQTFEKTISVPPPQEKDNRYFYIPFVVPGNVKSLTISYEYDKKGGANVLDLGVFDARFDVAENDVKGFRGWSGGRRSTVFIAENFASHGYVAGKIHSGTWRVVLGLYKVAPEGVDVAVKVGFNEIEQTAQTEFDTERAKTYEFPKTKKIAPPNFNGLTWFRGDLHAHTFYSDGNWTVKSLLDYADGNNLDFLGITEHNTFAHHAEINQLAPQYKNLLVLRGEEVTTYGGHFNVWGLPTGEMIDFRVAPKDTERLRKSIERVRQLNLIASLNHPTALCGGCDWSYGDWTTMEAVEIWNGAWDLQDEAALKKWDGLLQQGKRITAIGSSDSHAPPLPEYKNGSPLGTPTTHVGMRKLAQKDLLAAIKAARVWLGANPADYRLEFSAFNGSQIDIGSSGASLNGSIRFNFGAYNFPVGAAVSLISNGKVLLEEEIREKNYASAKEFSVVKDAYFRLEVRSATGAMLALTNPIYIQVKK
ncbi:MAG: CehA/McbA family metallohydrolase [Acidobacteriota bacterium]|nr:CehA/McbA family metallohydrolase [Acidobacteriota bacterium]